MAKINQRDIEQLRERADLVEIVSGHTTLRRAGGRTLKGLCPFHSEKTPSFTVDSSRGLYFCFGCQKGGDVYTFVQEIEALPFKEAVEWVARRQGYDLRYEEGRAGDRSATGLRKRLLETNAQAAAFMHRNLMDAPEALAARRYLQSRGFLKELAGRWQLGYALGRDSLCRHLLEKGFTGDEIIKAGLGRRSERDSSLYDTFRQRITFPTWDLQGAVVGFGARALGDQQPKYLNTAETPVFHKSRVMYGLNRAKSSIARGAAAIVVEGYTDVIALHEGGVPEAVATNGVALGESHFQQLKKFTERVILMLDSDAAGQGATERSFDVHHRLGIEVLVATLPAGRDPADVVREDGAEAIRKVLDGAQPIIEFKLDQMLSKLNLDTPEARARAVRQAAQVLGWHPDPIARHEYAFRAAERIGVEPETVQRALAEVRREGYWLGEPPEREHDRRLPGHVKVEREALQMLLTRAKDVGVLVDAVSVEDFTSPVRRELFGHARTMVDNPRGAPISEDLSEACRSLYTELMVGLETEAEENLAERIEEVFIRIKVFSLEREIKRRRETLQQVNPVEDPGRHDDLFTQLVALEAERRDMLRRLHRAG
jgi:DNA primase